jgi:hypothetical protein
MHLQNGLERKNILRLVIDNKYHTVSNVRHIAYALSAGNVELFPQFFGSTGVPIFRGNAASSVFGAFWPELPTPPPTTMVWIDN